MIKQISLKNPTHLLMIAVITLTVILGLIFSIQRNKQDQNNWKTFQSKWHPLIINYPPGGLVSPHVYTYDYEKNITTLGNKINTITIYANDPVTNLYIEFLDYEYNQYLKENNQFNLEKFVNSKISFWREYQAKNPYKEPITKNGWQGYLVRDIEYGIKKDKEILYVNHNNRLYGIRFDADNPLDLAIINTLRFDDEWKEPTSPFEPYNVLDTEHWQTFKHARLPYTLKYPLQGLIDLGTDNSGKQISIILPPSYRRGVIIGIVNTEKLGINLDTRFNLKEFVEQKTQVDNNKPTEVTEVAGENWQGYQFTSPNNNQLTNLYIVHNSTLYYLFYNKNKPLEKTIVQSLKFVDQS